ncbi:EamA family transporter [Flindersiella endophytica]
MSFGVLVLLLVAASAHAVWNLVAKRAGCGGTLFVWMYQTVSAILFLPVAVVATVVIHVRPDRSWLLAVAVTGVLHAGYALALQHGYAAGDLSVVYPVARGSGPLLSVLAAVVVFGERPGWIGLVGAVAVVAGVLLIAIRPRQRSAAVAVSVRHGLLAGVLIAAFTLWDAYVMRVVGVPELLYYCGRCCVQSLLLTPYAILHRGRIAEQWRANRPAILTIATVAPVASVLVLIAMRTAPVTLVAPGRELSIVIGTIVAWRWLGEPDPVRRLGGSFVVLTGIAAIALAASQAP